MSKIVVSLSLVLALALAGAFLGCGDSERAAEAHASTALPHASPVPAHGGEASVTLTPPPLEVVPPVEAAPEEPEVWSEDEGPELRAVGGLRARRFVLARGVEDREPVEPGVRFPNEARPLYAFVDLENTGDQDRVVTVIFETPDGRTVGHVALTVPGGAPRWRTWALSRMITEPGAWTATVVTEDGEVLGRQDFEVVEQS